MLPRNISLPFMFITLVLIVLFLCMLCYFHLWFACNKRYRKKYQAKQTQEDQQDQLETALSGLHSTVDGKIFEVQHDGTKKQVGDLNDLSLIWRHFYSSAGDYHMAVTFFWGKRKKLQEQSITKISEDLFVSSISCYFYFDCMYIKPGKWMWKCFLPLQLCLLSTSVECQ